MSRLRATLALVALLAPGIASGQANGQSDPALWRFVYPNAKVLVSIDWERIRQSQAGATFREKWRTASSMPMPMIPGMELLNDIDRVLFSSPGNKSPSESTQPPVLIAIHGHFDPAKVREIFTSFGAKPQAYNSFQVYRPQDKQAKGMAFVLFDGETILVGDAPSIFATLDRNHFGPPPPESDSTVARAAEMEAKYDFWVIMDATEALSNDSVAALFHGGEWASEARGFEAGASLRTGFVADIAVRFSSDAAAKRMTTELTRVVNLASKDKSQGAELQDIVKKLKFVADGPASKISLRLTQQEMEKTAQALAASYQAGAQLAKKSGLAANPRFVLAPAPTPAKPAVIRIEGLDDGPREIPYQDPQH